MYPGFLGKLEFPAKTQPYQQIEAGLTLTHISESRTIDLKLHQYSVAMVFFSFAVFE